jgi:O-antigen ligase
MQEIKSYNFLRISTLLICFLPLAMLTGPAIPDFIVIVTSIYFLFYLFFIKANITYLKKFFIYFLCFYFFLITSSIFSSNIWLSLKFTIPYIRFILLAFLISYLIRNNKKKFFLYFFISCFLSTIMLFIDSLFEYNTGKNLLGHSSKVNGRVSSLFGDELILGSYILKISPLLLTSFFFLEISNSKKKIFFFTLLFIFFTIIFISGDRAPLFLFCVFFLTLYFLLKPYRKEFLVVILLMITVSIALTSFNKNLYNRLVTQTINEIGFGQENYNLKALGLNEEAKKLTFYKKKIYLFSAQHHNYFLTGINIFKDNLFFGAGPKLFFQLSSQKKYAIDNLSQITHPHNFYIQLLAETGLIGFCMVFFFFLYLVKKIFDLKNACEKTFNQSNKIIIGISISGLIFHLWPIITTGSFFTNYNCIMIYMCVGFFLGQIKDA